MLSMRFPDAVLHSHVYYPLFGCTHFGCLWQEDRCPVQCLRGRVDSQGVLFLTRIIGADAGRERDGFSWIYACSLWHFVRHEAGLLWQGGPCDWIQQVVAVQRLLHTPQAQSLDLLFFSSWQLESCTLQLVIGQNLECLVDHVLFMHGVEACDTKVHLPLIQKL